MKGRPLLIPLASIIAGALLAGLFSWYFSRFLLLPLVLLSVLAAISPKRLPFLLAVSFLFMWLGNASLQALLNPDLPANHVVRFASDEPLILEGTVDSRVEKSRDGSRLYLQMERIYRGSTYLAVTGRLLLTVGTGQPQVLTGDRIRIISPLRKPRNYGLPGEFDFVRHLALKQVYITAFVRETQEVILVKEGDDYSLQRYVDQLAGNIGSFIGRAVPTEEGGILRALLIGERGHVSKELEAAYARTGVNHILSISGFHVAIVGLFIFHLMLAVCRNMEKLAIYCNLRKTLLIITLPLIVFYLLLSGTAPATTRSVIMIAGYVCALVLEREIEPINSLLLAAFVILSFTPGALFDISFQLSFVALWGIIVLTPLLMRPFSMVGETKLRTLLMFSAASLAAILTTLLPVAFYFHRVSFTGLISNLVVVPLMGYGAVVLGFTSLPFITAVPFIAKSLLVGAAFLVKASNVFILFVSQIPTITVFTPDRLDLFLFYLILATVTFAIGNKQKILMCPILFFIMLSNSLYPMASEQGKLKITFFSVGQGEATLISFPDGKKMLVDGGGSHRDNGLNVGERLLAPALWAMGVNTIDYLVLTHGHPDHLQGLLYIAGHFTIGEFWESGITDDSEGYQQLKHILKARHVPLRRIDSSHADSVIGGGTFQWLWPPVKNRPYADLNDDSLAFRLIYKHQAVLFTGDIGSAVENELVKTPQKLKCDVLKVPHHGSKYSSSSAFLDAADPEIAVVSAGFGNSFHLPAPQTLNKLQQRDIKLCRTDLDGTITLEYDEMAEKFQVVKPNRHFN